jgi:hypothetical protein
MSVTRRFLSYGMLFGVIAATMSAGCASTQSQVREIDPQADPILKRMCDTLDGAKAIRFRVRAAMERPVETGQLAEFHRTSEITMVRPDRLCAKTDSDDGKWSAWYRGKTLTMLDREANEYATEQVPGRVGEMLDYMVEKYDLVVPMADLLVGQTYDSMLANVDSGSYLGLHTVGETKCHHLLFRQENIDWQIWIDAGKQPLPRKLVITYKQEPDEPQYVAIIDNWDLAPAYSDEVFTFTPPAGAKSVTMSNLIEER